jgi:hypothetical protein
VEWDDFALTAKYYVGLKESVKDELARMERPDELKELVEQSIKIDNRLYERQLKKRKDQPTFFRHKSQANTFRHRPRNQGLYPREMDLDATHLSE